MYSIMVSTNNFIFIKSRHFVRTSLKTQTCTQIFWEFRHLRLGWHLHFLSTLTEKLEQLYAEADITGKPANFVNVEMVPCTIISMDFFDRLLLPGNGIVGTDKRYLIQCMEEEIDGYLIGDKLRHMLLNRESNYYNLYTDSEHNQFLFRIFLHMCLGGQWCQYEDIIQPYLDAAKLLYRDLLSVEKVSGTNELVVRSVVLKVNTLDTDCRPLCPQDQNNVQNFMYLIVDPFKRTVTTFTHQMGGFFI